jgi:hypothetical protein
LTLTAGHQSQHGESIEYRDRDAAQNDQPDAERHRFVERFQQEAVHSCCLQQIGADRVKDDAERPRAPSGAPSRS